MAGGSGSSGVLECGGVLDSIVRLVEGEFEGRVFLHKDRGGSGSLLLRLYMRRLPLMMVAEIFCDEESLWVPYVVVDAPGLFLQASRDGSLGLVDFLRVFLVTLNNLRVFYLSAGDNGMPIIVFRSDYFAELLGEKADADTAAGVILSLLVDLLEWAEESLVRLQMGEPLKPLTMEELAQKHADTKHSFFYY